MLRSYSTFNIAYNSYMRGRYEIWKQYGVKDLFALQRFLD